MNRNRTVVTIVAAAAVLALIGAVVVAVSSRSQDVSATPTTDGPLVAFYGDSYTLGTGASDPSKRWSTRISIERGWNEFNPSVNGLGFINNRGAFGADSGDLPDQIIAANPDIVLVTMGLNDNFSFAERADEIKTQISDDLQRLKSALPDARFIVVEPFWYTDTRPESVDTIIGWVEDAASAIDADYIPGASRWIEGRPDWKASDNLHPNDAGYDAMTTRMDDALTELGL